MSEIQGFSPTQPLRSAPPQVRPAIARSVEAEPCFGFGSDDVQVSSRDLETAPSPLPEPAAAAPAVAVLPRAETPAIAEVDGFIVAGAGQAPTSLSRGADVGRSFSAGPIAMLDEPGPAALEFPGLSLNGPSTAAEGLFGLSGFRLA